ncbi:DUF4197 domain-containing protein [Sulfurimonas sp. SAG-AH-194-I05]|nr:DUF4197 domain-containing protein [Sulfurimonas sp. SAG-AH-194-I05]MDF1874665.1 DUF4197 domain-containing protein [Sulfurimonas sp. SAG-AH-194-I05]
MKITNTIILAILLGASTLSGSWMDIFSEGAKVLEQTTAASTSSKTTEPTDKITANSLSTFDMNTAFKQALSKGVEYAISTLSKENGYFKNEITKIGLPANLQKTAELIRKAGGGKYVDNLVLALNNAATQAAPKTAAIFTKSITDMSVDDVKKILSGSNHAGTDYFREKTTKDLQATIAPIIQKSMDNNDVTKYYNAFNSFYKQNAGVLKNEYVSGLANAFGYGDFIPNDKDEDINTFVTNKSIDGIMTLIQEKEKIIRDNPLGQNSEILGKVFSVFE